VNRQGKNKTWTFPFEKPRLKTNKMKAFILEGKRALE